MRKRRRFKQTDPLDKRISEQVERLHEKAQSAPPGPEKDRLMRRAQFAETASHVSEWLNSSGLRSPD
ncbi:hypothetical protein LMTR13_32500 [Bradyrhizobium icense]|uniref:Uncharacterized protein n=1 Tax=Bradyrhizobium icense TaxID=1274631 RepID=A0A1B1UN42_9BRAD|nr:hypothetical protein LMTR13_32500 [Bradyrhizobium icense]